MERIFETLQEIEEILDAVTSAIRDMSHPVGYELLRLGDVARLMVPGWFERHTDITVEGELEPTYVGGGENETKISLFGKGRRTNSEEVIIAGECKSKIYSGEVKSFAKVLETVRSAYKGIDVLAFMFGYLVHPSADEEAKGYDIVVLAPYRK
nr:hypothetical protein [Candidatus Freyarchaeota archaeon]